MLSNSRISSLYDFLALLRGVKQARDGQYLALCPGHHDTEPSLSVREADGKVLLKCFAGCEPTDILKPLNLELKDLFLNSHKSKPEQRAIVAVDLERLLSRPDVASEHLEVVRTWLQQHKGESRQ